MSDIKLLGVSNLAPTLKGRQLLIKVNVKVQNNNFFAVNLKKSNLTLSIEDENIGDLILTEKIKINCKSTEFYPLKFKVELADGVFFTLFRNVFKKEVIINLKGTLVGSILGIPKTIAVNETKAIDGNLFKSFSN
jgi:LEA14-like dessication related protein